MPNSTAPQPECLRVAIIEDERDIRECLSLLVNGTPGFSCTGGYRTMGGGLEAPPRLSPAVWFRDMGVKEMGVREGAKIKKPPPPPLLVLMLTVYEDDER